MDTLSADSQSDIDTVVDDQGDTIALGDLVQFGSCGDLNTGVTRLVSVLDDGDAYRRGRLAYVKYWKSGRAPHPLGWLHPQPGRYLDPGEAPESSQ